jgi:glycosyltransferase involved in cell wall biosynthesis
LRILLATPFYEPAWGGGGVARASSGLARALGRGGHEVLVVTTRWDDAHAEEEQAQGVRVRRFRSPRWLRERLFPWPVGLARFLATECGRIEAAHIAGHRNGFAAIAGRMLVRTRIPYVVQPHGTYPHHGSRTFAKRVVDLAFGAALIGRAAELVAVSHAEARELPRPAQVVPNGVDAVGTPGTGRVAGAPRILFVGSAAPQKRGHVFEGLLQRLPDATLDLVGRFGPAFRARFARFSSRALFRGVLGGDELASVYASASLLVHPAVGEAFGLAPFEAALAGTAAIVAGGHGCGEWFAKAGGCVVPPDDGEALAGAVRLRLNDRALAEREGAAVAGFARSELSWSAVARRLAELYEAIRGRAPSSAGTASRG